MTVGLYPVATARAQEPPRVEGTPHATSPTEAIPGRPEPPPPIPPAWTERLDEVDQRARIVERRLELAEEAAAAARKQTPVVFADDTGFGLRSADGRSRLRLGGLLQVDARRFLADAVLDDRDTVLPRRVRPILDATLLGLVDVRLMPDFGGGQAVLIDAFLDIRPRPWLRVRVGKQKTPLGLERLQNDRDVTFVERALDQNLTPQRDVGVLIWGEIAGALLRYEAGIFNGAVDNAINDADVSHAKTFAGRLFVQPFAPGRLRELGRLGLGFAASTGDEQGTGALTTGVATGTWLPTFRTAGQVGIFSYLASTTDPAATTIALGRHTRLNPQLFYYLGPFGVLAEAVREIQNVARGADAARLVHHAGHVTVSWAFGGDVAYEGVSPRRALDLASGGLGAFELAARVHWLDVDGRAFPTFADPSRSVTEARGLGVGASWYPSRSLRASAAFETTTFRGGAAGDSSPGDRATERLLVARLQTAF